jgi:hypothetical protein
MHSRGRRGACPLYSFACVSQTTVLVQYLEDIHNQRLPPRPSLAAAGRILPSATAKRRHEVHHREPQCPASRPPVVELPHRETTSAAAPVPRHEVGLPVRGSSLLWAELLLTTWTQASCLRQIRSPFDGREQGKVSLLRLVRVLFKCNSLPSPLVVSPCSTPGGCEKRPWRSS